MTPERFHAELSKLIKRAHKGELCAGCVVRELICAAEAVSLLAQLSNADLAEHGIPTLQLLEGREHLH